MVKASKGFLAFVVIIIVIIGFIATIVIYNEMNSKSEAEDLILSGQDVGDGWVGFDRGTVNIPPLPNATSSCFRQVQNATIGAELILYVFNSENESKYAYYELNQVLTSALYSNQSYRAIGDGLFYYENGIYPGSNLLVGRTVTMLWIDQGNFDLEPWFKNSILATANLQAQKIRQHLGK